MTQTTFTFRVDADLKDSFTSVAKTHDRSAAQLLRDHMRDIVRKQEEAKQHDVWFREQVQLGIDSANAGNLVPNDEVEAEFAARRAETRRKLDKLS